MNRLKILISLLNIPRLIPHIILFYRYYEKCLDDVEINSAHKIKTNKTIIKFLYLLVYYKYYRNLFYYRIGVVHHFICFLAPKMEFFFISPTTKIGKGLQLGHCFSTVINAESIGSNCSIYQDVTIGVSGHKKPIIHDNVQIFANSTIIGGIEIGNNVSIGAGTILTKSVPANSVVVGNPARIIKQNGQKVNVKL